MAIFLPLEPDFSLLIRPDQLIMTNDDGEVARYSGGTRGTCFGQSEWILALEVSILQVAAVAEGEPSRRGTAESSGYGFEL